MRLLQCNLSTYYFLKTHALRVNRVRLLSYNLVSLECSEMVKSPQNPLCVLAVTCMLQSKMSVSGRLTHHLWPVEVSSNIKTKTLFVCQAGDMDKSFSGIKWTSVRIKHRQLTFGNCPCTKDKLAELVWPCNCAVMSYERLWCFTGNFYLNVSLLGSLAFTNLHFIETQKFNLNSSIGTTNDTEHRGQWLTMQSNKKVI